MSEIKFCPKCGAECVEGVQKCSCGYEYPKKGLSTGAIVAIVLVAVFLPSLLVFAIVAALTVPTLVNRQNDLEAQVRLKKAVSNYEDVALIYMAENDKKSLAYAFGSNCENIDDYFYTASKQGCNFTTVDGVYWEIDPYTGNAAISDSKDNPLYSVVVWNGNEKVNNESNIPSNLKMPSTEPVKCVYYADEFMRASISQLKDLCKK